MEEDSVRALLTKIADTPEPPPARIDVERARRDGRRRQWTARVAIPAAALTAAAVALGIIVTVPHALTPMTERSRPIAAPTPSPARVLDAPEQFNPLVPYANFGWLPSGFSQASVSPLNGGTFSTDLDTVVRTAGQPSTNRMLQLTVNSASACKGITAHPGRPHPSQELTTDCAFSGYGITGTASPVNGRPAYWVHYDSLAWQYAPGAWAVLVAEIPPLRGKPTPSSAYGWTLGPGKNTPSAQVLLKDPTIGKIIDADPSLAIAKGYVIPPTAATLALVHQVAAQVKFGQKQPLVFPFQMSGGLPSGWQLNSTSFQVSGNTAVGTSIGFGSALDTSAGSVSASSPNGYGCNFVTGQSSYVTRYGVSWIYRIIVAAGQQSQSLCSTGSTGTPVGLVDGLQVWVNLDESSPGSNAPLPGVIKLGGAFGIYSRLKFLGADPTDWTTQPLISQDRF